MTIKAIMVDVDGVLIVHPDGNGWAANLDRDLGLSGSRLHSAFFEPHWDDVVHGRASLRERLTPVLATIAPHLRYEDLVDYWFRHDAHIDLSLMAELARIRRDGAEVHLATVQEHERARYIWEALDFQRAFDGMHYAAELGFSKPDPRFFRSIESRTGFSPQDLYLIDDRPANIAGARACGWDAALWTGVETLGALVSNRLARVR
ncbi:MAG: HAD family hydrolase [Novosphingobium sp.]